MARSRFLAGCLLITCMFVSLLICLESTKADMCYDLLLATVIYFNLIATPDKPVLGEKELIFVKSTFIIASAPSFAAFFFK